MKAEQSVKSECDYRFVVYGNTNAYGDEMTNPSWRHIPIICNKCLINDNVIKLYFQKVYIHLKTGLKSANGCPRCRSRTCSNRSKKLWEDTDFRERKTEATRIQNQSPEFRKLASERLKALHQDPEFKAHLHSDEVNDKRSDSYINYSMLLLKQ